MYDAVKRLKDALGTASKSSDLNIVANEIIERGRIPLALFLEDCLRSVDPAYMTTIVKRYVETRYSTDKSKRLYWGENSMIGSRGQERTSLQEFDTLFLLHLFSFAIGTRHEQNQADGWHPRLGDHFPFESTVLNKIKVLKDWRNDVHHEPDTLRSQTDHSQEHLLQSTHSLKDWRKAALIDRKAFNEEKLSALLSDYKYIYIHNVLEVIQRVPESFRVQTKTELQEYRSFLSQQFNIPKGQSRNRYHAVLAVASILAIATVVVHVTRGSDAPRPCLMILQAEAVSPSMSYGLTRLLKESMGEADSIRVMVFVDSADAYINRTIANDTNDLHELVRSMSAMANPMPNYTRLTAAFNYAFEKMMALDSTSYSCQLYFLGHVPPEPNDEEYDRLLRAGWNPGSDSLLTVKWRKRSYGRPKWVFSGVPSKHDRVFFELIMHSRDSTLLPVEYPI